MLEILVIGLSPSLKRICIDHLGIQAKCKMNINEISQKFLDLQRQVNSLASELPDDYQLNFEIADFSRAEDIVPRKRLLISVKRVDQDLTTTVINKAKRVW